MEKNRSVLQIRVAAADTEFQNVLSNPRYFEWFSRGRIEYYRDHGLLSIDESGIPSIDGKCVRAVLVNVNCRFHSIGRFDDLLELVTTVSHIGEHSITFSHELFNLSRGHALVASAQAVQVFLDAATGQKCPVPERLRKLAG
ncbi:MAG: acyl-CoA thioesterase [Dehalococcoidia bacterium]|nr:acyl-CoA thioesterase [Dehalococcoidia bacterium]